MTLASPWMLRAMSEHGQPSSSRVVSVVGLLVFAPLLLVGMMRWVPTAAGECFIAYVAICGGVYVGSRFAPLRTPADPSMAPPPPVPKEAVP